MARKALSETKKTRIRREEHDQAMARAVVLYQQELAKPGSEKHASLRTICREVERQFFVETKKKITLNHNTLNNLAKGGQTKAESNAARGWLTKEEEEEVVKFAIEIADWGYPLSHRRLKEHVDNILRARLGSKFPKGGVGKQWTSRFIEKSNQLHVYAGKSLHCTRGQAVNPTANTQYFDMVGEVQLHGDNGNPILPECTYAMDEVGFQPGGDEGFEWVIGRAGKKMQYKQQKGTRENITVLVTICGDGTVIPPAVIFKGKAYLMRWLQDNPANASLGYSKKGWTNREISLEWGKHFEAHTRGKAKGRARSLFLDGHDSHVTYEFLQHCRENNIIAPGYPAHGTHVYQSLDVCIFGPLKREFGRLRDELCSAGEAITKENFLKIYGQAHLKVLTPELVKTAFRKVGIVPFDRSVVTDEMMAPSKDTSYKVLTPVIPPTPVRIVSDLLLDAIQPSRNTAESSSSAQHEIHPQPIRLALPQLAGTALGYLVSQSPVKSSDPPPQVEGLDISPIKIPTAAERRRDAAREKSPREIELEEELEIANARLMKAKGQVLQAHAQVVIAGVYCGRVRRQLQAKEKKTSEQDNGGKLGGKLAPLLTSDKFIEAVRQRQEKAEATRQDKLTRKHQKKDHTKKIKQWEKAEERRKGRNEAREAQWKQAVADWEHNRAEAKAKGEKLKDWESAHPRPKKSDPEFKPEPAISKPKLRKTVAEDEDGSEGEEFDLNVSSSDEEEAV